MPPVLGRVTGASVWGGDKVSRQGSQFDYILDEIHNAKFDDGPFRHIYIEDVFQSRHFAEIVRAPEVNLRRVDDDEELISELYANNFKEIAFPGTTTNIAAYLKWHKNPQKQQNLNQETTEGFGVTLRLRRATSGSILGDIMQFFDAPQFWECAAAKFGIKLAETRIDTGLQKYLDGYEISPHPDIRKKALTFMININPARNSEDFEYHTHYLRFRPERDYIREFWSRHEHLDRCWVPWAWCETVKRQARNNSMVMFAPANDTLHAIKASYGHLATQRTQYYGNLWFKESPVQKGTTWRDLVPA
jgi:hypothetical protein